MSLAKSRVGWQAAFLQHFAASGTTDLPLLCVVTHHISPSHTAPRLQIFNEPEAFHWLMCPHGRVDLNKYCSLFPLPLPDDTHSDCGVQLSGTRM